MHRFLAGALNIAYGTCVLIKKRTIGCCQSLAILGTVGWIATCLSEFVPTTLVLCLQQGAGGAPAEEEREAEDCGRASAGQAAVRGESMLEASVKP